MTDSSSTTPSSNIHPPSWVAKSSWLNRVWENPVFQLYYSRERMKSWLGLRWSFLAGLSISIVINLIMLDALGDIELGYWDFVRSVAMPAIAIALIMIIRLLVFLITTVSFKFRDDLMSGKLDIIFASTISTAEIQEGISYSTFARGSVSISESVLAVLGVIVGYFVMGLVLGFETLVYTLNQVGLVSLNMFIVMTLAIASAVGSTMLATVVRPARGLVAFVLFVIPLGAVLATYYNFCVLIPQSSVRMVWFFNIIGLLLPALDYGLASIWNAASCQDNWLERFRRQGYFDLERMDSAEMLSHKEVLRGIKEFQRKELGGLVPWTEEDSKQGQGEDGDRPRT